MRLADAAGATRKTVDQQLSLPSWPSFALRRSCLGTDARLATRVRRRRVSEYLRFPVQNVPWQFLIVTPGRRVPNCRLRIKVPRTRENGTRMRHTRMQNFPPDRRATRLRRGATPCARRSDTPPHFRESQVPRLWGWTRCSIQPPGTAMSIVRRKKPWLFPRFADFAEVLCQPILQIEKVLPLP